MAKAATYKIYNGTAWEELTFKPSYHTHDGYDITMDEEYLRTTNITGYSTLYGFISKLDTALGNLGSGSATIPDDLEVSTLKATDGVTIGGDSVIEASLTMNEWIYCHNTYGIENTDETSSFGFTDEGKPCINNPFGRYLLISTNALDDDPIEYMFPEESGQVAMVTDIPKYYQHTITLSKTSSTTHQLTFTVINKSPTALTAATIYSKYPSKAFACSGYYGTNVAIKIAFTSATQFRVVYGTGASTSVISVSTVSDTVMEIV